MVKALGLVVWGYQTHMQGRMFASSQSCLLTKNWEVVARTHGRWRRGGLLEALWMIRISIMHVFIMIAPFTNHQNSTGNGWLCLVVKDISIVNKLYECSYRGEERVKVWLRCINRWQRVGCSLLTVKSTWCDWKNECSGKLKGRKCVLNAKVTDALVVLYPITSTIPLLV